ncbi:MAG TPA: hypothetical protein VMM93_03940 [Vicinamibacterales bacterium]|nr:hypothetical protein [Vicinamibacterales bacterium]
MSADHDPARRLWRARRQHDAIDAVVIARPSDCELRFVRNGRLLVAWSFNSRDAAALEADTRLRALQRAGWTSHW